MKNNNIVYIKDFVSVNDPECAKGIRKAIKYAIDNDANTLIFEAGKYYLQDYIQVETEGILHDSGKVNKNPIKDCFISLKGINNFTIKGACDDNGEPATIFVGNYDGSVHKLLPSILWCEDCENLFIENIAFTRYPEYASAGVVLDKNEKEIIVEVLEGNPSYDNMGTYCMNRFNPKTKALMGESLSYGRGASNNWILLKDRLIKLVDEKIANKVNVGDLLSWHQGARTDFQVYFGRCNNLKLNNLRTFNANGFCMLSENCHNITANKVVFKPKGNQLFTGPRDAWKLYKCSGEIQISNMYVQGVRMDGQNMHSIFLVLKEKISDNEAIFYGKSTFTPIDKDSTLEFYDDERIEECRIKEYRYKGKDEMGHYYQIKFYDNIPKFAKIDTLSTIKEWEPSRYICQNSNFINIAGAGHLVRNDNLTIINCKYQNTMNPGILLGAELPNFYEGGHATNILIKSCEFDNCGFHPRYTAVGCIGIKSAGFSGKHNKNIIITDNVFKNSDIGIFAIDADDVYVLHNKFENIEKELVTEPNITGEIFFK